MAWWCPFNALQVTGWNEWQWKCVPGGEGQLTSLIHAPEASCDRPAFHPLPAVSQERLLHRPQKGRPWTGHGRGGWNYKGVSTNNRKRVLPSSGSLRLAGKEARGQARGCRAHKPLSSGRRGRWACSRGAGGRQWMAEPSALARGIIQTLEEESLPVCQGALGSSCRHRGDPRP